VLGRGGEGRDAHHAIDNMVGCFGGGGIECVFGREKERKGVSFGFAL
jgi:hypothetical protein